MKTQNDRREKKTPLMLFGLEIVNRTGFKYGVLKYASGKSDITPRLRSYLSIVRLTDWLTSMMRR